MSLARHITHLMASISPDDLDALRPVDRRLFAELCRRCADLADRPEPPRGVLAELRGTRPADVG